eukprot:GHRQ01018916.1.p1 GENE.GHRQ01018916.1~~GHRQ01018916.1.p1  ORF type:complete len:135 (+),score=32.12 GHRQ01018916.1:829-1233(+)
MCCVFARCRFAVVGTCSMQSMLEFLRGICSDVKVVQGDFDDFESPEQLVSSSSCCKLVQHASCCCAVDVPKSSAAGFSVCAVLLQLAQEHGHHSSESACHRVYPAADTGPKVLSLGSSLQCVGSALLALQDAPR